MYYFKMMSQFCWFLLVSFLLCGRSFSCSKDCIESFGNVLGESDHVPAYSNCNDSCVSKEDSFISLGQDQVYTGLKWQCVEYARRWLIVNRKVTFKSVDNAYDIWNLSTFQDIQTHQERPFIKYMNKVTSVAPAKGDLLIYSKDFLITGHVAVVVKVESNRIKLAEANYFNAKWVHPDFSREVLMVKDQKGKYTLYDEHLLGWLRVK